MQDETAIAMLSAIEAIDDLRAKVYCWKAEIHTVARVVSMLPEPEPIEAATNAD